MNIFNKKVTIGQLQAIIWSVVSFLDFFSNFQYGPLLNALRFTLLDMLFYAYIIVGNTYWLIPYFYSKKRIAIYIVLLLLLIISAIIFGSLGTVLLDNMNNNNMGKPVLTEKIFTYHTFSAILIFIFSMLYRFTLDYFVLSKKQSEINAEKAQTQLHLLKQQVNPHFLFNTLNNIYYVAQKESPKSAELIERLADIMRYFVDESNKEKVLLKDELALIKSYIELESMRMRYEMPIDFKINGDVNYIIVPPLLLLPMVENIFKHGVNKRSKENFAEITLAIEQDKLRFSTKNRYYFTESEASGSKTGLANLDKRLKLYYENNYQLNFQKQSDLFIAQLEIIFYEN
jgi:sensor histidine kinase YesM